MSPDNEPKWEPTQILDVSEDGIEIITVVKPSAKLKALLAAAIQQEVMWMEWLESELSSRRQL